MTARIAHRLAKTSGQAVCSRCLDIIDVQAGCWISAEPDGPAAVCDRCSERDDPAGHAALQAWRRAATGPTTGRRWAA